MKEDQSTQPTHTVTEEKKEPEFICPTCEKEAGGGTIQCDSCMMWLHFKCANISEDIAGMIDETTPFTCPSCQQSLLNIAMGTEASRHGGSKPAAEATDKGSSEGQQKIKERVVKNTSTHFDPDMRLLQNNLHSAQRSLIRHEEDNQ